MSDMVICSNGSLTPWTDERVALLKKYNEEGLSRSEIAAKLGAGISRNAVIGKLMRLGIRPVYLAGKPRRLCAPHGPRPRVTKRPASYSYIKIFNGKMEHVKLAEVFDLEPENIVDPVPLMKLSAHTCRWPVNGVGEFLFCGAEPTEGKPYCARHCRMAYVKPEKKDYGYIGRKYG